MSVPRIFTRAIADSPHDSMHVMARLYASSPLEAAADQIRAEPPSAGSTDVVKYSNSSDSRKKNV